MGVVASAEDEVTVAAVGSLAASAAAATATPSAGRQKAQSGLRSTKNELMVMLRRHMLDQFAAGGLKRALIHRVTAIYKQSVTISTV